LLLDPFVGSGTVLLEAALLGHNTVGADPNPLARLVTRVKTRRVSVDAVRLAGAEVVRHARRRHADPPEVAAYWYTEKVLHGLAQLGDALSERGADAVSDALRVALAATANGLSMQDPSVPVPVHLKSIAEPPATRAQVRRAVRFQLATTADPFAVFLRNVDDQAQRLTTPFPTGHRASRVFPDARQIPGNISVDAIVTSPPYGPAQKYVRATQLPLAFLGYPTRESQRPIHAGTIGRERHIADAAPTYEGPDSVAAELLLRITPDAPVHRIWSAYLVEIEDALRVACRALRPGGSFVLVAGENVVRHEVFDTSGYLVRCLTRLGLTIQYSRRDELRGWTLQSSRKGSAPRLASETVTVLSA